MIYKQITLFFKIQLKYLQIIANDSFLKNPIDVFTCNITVFISKIFTSLKKPVIKCM